MKNKRVKYVNKLLKQLRNAYPLGDCILVDKDELSDLLHRLKKLEKKEAKRKAKKAAAAAEIGEAEALYGVLKEGDRVALTKTLDTHLWPYVIEGAEGTVKRIDTGGSYNVRVVLDNANGHPLSFQRSELRKITRGK